MSCLGLNEIFSSSLSDPLSEEKKGRTGGRLGDGALVQRDGRLGENAAGDLTPSVHEDLRLRTDDADHLARRPERSSTCNGPKHLRIKVDPGQVFFDAGLPGSGVRSRASRRQGGRPGRCWPR